MKRWQQAMRGGAVFSLGVVLGVAGTHLALRWHFSHVMRNRPASQQQMVVRHLTRQLQLNRAQQETLRPIIADQIQALSALRQRHQPEIDAVFQQGAADMKAHLTPEQQARLDKVLKRLRRHPRGPGQPGLGRRPLLPLP